MSLFFNEGEQADAYKARKEAESSKNRASMNKYGYNTNGRRTPENVNRKETNEHPYDDYGSMHDGTFDQNKLDKSVKHSKNLEKERVKAQTSAQRKNSSLSNLGSYVSARINAGNDKETLGQIEKNMNAAKDAAMRHERRHPKQQIENAFLAEACDNLI